MPSEPGTISLGVDNSLHITVDGEHYLLEANDVRTLLFHGRVVPITQILPRKPDGNPDAPTVAIEGHAAINRAGKAVVFYTRAGHFIIPLVSIQRVARGEAVSAPLFPLIAFEQDGPA